LVDEWLPKAHILHPWPSERFAVNHPRWEPCARIGLARIWCSEASCHSSGGESRQQRSPVAVVDISSNGEGDRSVGSLEVKALGGRVHRSDPYRGASNLAGRSKLRESGSPEIRAPRETDCGRIGSAELLRPRRRPCRHRSSGLAMIELPGVIESGMPRRNGSESPEPPAGRLGAPAQRRHCV